MQKIIPERTNIMKFKHKLTRVISMVLCIVMIFPCLYADAFNFTPTTVDGKNTKLTLYSKCVYMKNLTTGTVIVDINGEQERAPASMTKIMTAVVLLDKYNGNKSKLKSTYVSAGTAAFDELYNTGASTADIQPNEKVSYYDLLAALLIPSSCEAANIIALNLSSSLKGFAKLMNQKAKELKMNNTHFNNAHGLFAQNNYSSCKDIATLCEYALNNYSVFKEIVAMPIYTMGKTSVHKSGTQIINTNYMLESTSDYYFSSCKGIKTGSLDSAGRCLASYATKEGQTYLTVTMNAPMNKRSVDIVKGQENPDSIYADDIVYYNLLDHINLYKWAFNCLVSTDFIDPSSEVCDINVKYGDNCDYANLKPKTGYNAMWPTNIKTDNVKKKITLYKNVVAPIEVGDVLGKMELSYNGTVLATIDLVSTTRVTRSQIKAKAKVAKSFFSSKEFDFTVMFLLIGIIIYTVIHIVRIQKKYIKK